MSAVKKKVLAIIGLLFLVVIGCWYDVDDRMNYVVLDLMTAEQTKTGAIWLPGYQATIQAKAVECIDDNLSDISFNQRDKLFYLIVNSPSKLVIVDEKGNCINEVDLDLEDTEALVWVKDNQFLVSEERKFKVSLIEINQGIKNGYEIIESISLDFLKDNNLGLEALAYNAKNQSIMITKEKSPLLFYEISGFNSTIKDKYIRINQLLSDKNLYIDDLSGAYFHELTGHLMLLSDESKLLVEVDHTGNVISYIDLEKYLFGLKASIPQAEGITMDEQDNIYIISEPNLFYKFSPTQKVNI